MKRTEVYLKLNNVKNNLIELILLYVYSKIYLKKRTVSEYIFRKRKQNLSELRADLRNAEV